ncbi:MAG: hypothetical protein JSU68_08315 [Phycisphaerales bacterium]|nr:MAG: hypothetical protein JSU68_08315 [Phycisphaerales bacterium]
MWSTPLALQAGFDWSALLDEDVLVFLIPLAGCVIGLAAVIGHTWYRVVKAKSEAELKRLMIEQGLSADEIERIIEAGPESMRETDTPSRIESKRRTS